MDVLRKAEALLRKSEELGKDMNREAELWRQELEERKAKGITDETEGYNHFIEFMAKHGYTYNKQP